MLTWLEINQKNLQHNLQQFKNIVASSAIWPVVKSNAYGHGLAEIVSLLDKDPNVAGLAVVNLAEALEVSTLSSKPIMVLSYFEQDEEKLKNLSLNISLPVYTLVQIEYLDNLAKSCVKKFTVNIKIDTGTGRLGFALSEAETVIKQILAKENLQVNSIFSHFAESEAENTDFTKQQLADFQVLTTKFPQIKKHMACSAATVNQAEARADLIRLGLSLYGLWPSEATKYQGYLAKLCLKPILTWKTKIIQIKKMPAGTTIGYNRTYTCPEDCQLAVLPVGYNEGYPRSLSNKSFVLLQGKKYPVRGNICMNLMMVELPSGLSVKEGEVVVLLGRDGDSEISAEELATLAGTINYEIVTRINTNLPRIII
ncbi:MAG: Alanine racemase [Parcubacteria group bacterium GW2011_GWA2_36_10]|nr:MAG: Alanine racemase [Parcubacteria group bacterium GW2011_GWA2_36_10]